ncbi:hypothetical protein [Tunicatimonas pelagia]|uniref:hypothetical protein n=1 Tax=Tunicatimonas pelagia TaxID=931531 RepID=UPI002666E146|nr:hypothetical protein [Tunicatimonas pelagia]WKN42628.1 hypothetical protein P0M28_26680 [Tunicatimonas pelagia]
MRHSTKLIFAFVLMVATQNGYAQFLQPVEKRMDIGEKVTPAWVLAVEEPEEELRESIVNYTKEELRAKLKKGRNGLLIAKEVKVPSITSYTGDLKVLLSQVQNRTQVAVAFMPGYDISLNSDDYPNEMERLRQYTRNMLKYHMVNELQVTIKDDEKRLKDLEKDRKRNEREYRKLDKSTARMQRKINSDKTDENTKFDLSNEQEAAEDRMNTLVAEKDELNDEITKMNEKIQVSQEEINTIENRFVERNVSVSTEENESEEEEYKP